MFSASKTAAPSGGYTIQRSVRLRSSASAYFNRTLASSGTTATFSAWVKRGALGSASTIFGTTDGSTYDFQLTFTASNTLEFYSFRASAVQLDLITTQVFRDPSAWYHIVLVLNTTNATAANRVQMFVNGVQVTAFSTATYPAQNAVTPLADSRTFGIGDRGNANNNYFDGYLTEINFIDGQALTPSSFGGYNSGTGVWEPRKYAGTYGTNGFYLNFNDNSAATATAIGKDSSGNGNNWTPNNISVTAGVTYDSMTDVPTLTSATQANYAVMSPITGTTNLSNGNLYLTGAGAYRSGYSTISFPNTGKWYWEGVFTQANNNLGFGAASIGPNTPPNPLPNTNGIGITNGGIWYLDTSSGSSGHTGWSAATVVGMTWDSSSNTFAYTVDGTNYNTVGSVSTTDGRIWGPAAWCFATNDQLTLNFGQRPFSYTPPTGFNRLNTYNLPTPTIKNGAAQFAASTYTGNGSARSITNGGNNTLGTTFQPDLVWLKSRSNAYNNYWYDSVRGALKEIYSDSTSAEVTSTQTMTAFNSNGFSLGTDNGINQNTVTFIGWNWKASNASAVSNTSGSITSSVSANPTAGFSIVTYTGTGANATVGHGLGIAPKMVIVKLRSGSAGTAAWVVYHSSDNASPQSGYMRLDGTGAFASDTTAWNNTAPTSSVFSIGTLAGVNYAAANNYVAYCFSEIAGYSKFGSYTGNGSADGPFVYCGFRPRFVVLKRTNSTGNWETLDSSRNTYNSANTRIYPNLINAEDNGYSQVLDLLSNGFKLREGVDGSHNANGSSYIFMAFAENPFNYSLAR